MTAFPFFMELKGKKGIIVGGGAVAERKIRTLLDFDAEITVVSPEVNAIIHDLAQAGKIHCSIREYCSEDIDGTFFAIAATNYYEVNERVYLDAIAKGVMVNVVDCPEKCTFLFPSIVKRGDMVLGISTSGGYPALSGRIRQKLDTEFPEVIGEKLEIMKKYRTMAYHMIKDTAKRLEFITTVLDDMLDKHLITSEDFKHRIDAIFKEYV